jgi:hypothetical protein
VAARGGANGGASRHGTMSSQSVAIHWETPRLELYDHVNGKDLFSSLPADYKASNEPLIVYLTTDSADAGRQTKNAEETVLRDEQVGLGARLFRAIRLDGDRVQKSHPQWATLGGTALPRVVVVDAAGRKTGELEGNDLTANNVFKLMTRAAAKTYKSDLDHIVKEFHGVLDDLDAIEPKLARIAEQKKAATGAKLKELTADEQKLAAELATVHAREAELLKKFQEDRKVAKS